MLKKTDIKVLVTLSCILITLIQLTLAVPLSLRNPEGEERALDGMSDVTNFKSDHVMIFSSQKRGDGARNEEGKKRHTRKKHKNRKKKQKSRYNYSPNGKTSAVQFSIDQRHPSVPSGASGVLTGETGDIIQCWKYFDRKFANQEIGELSADGRFKVHREGVYFIYSQITYYDRTGRWSHAITVDGKTYTKCIASEWGIAVDEDTDLYHNTIHQCSTSTVALLRKGGEVTINSMYSGRNIHTDSDMTFWGIVKLS